MLDNNVVFKYETLYSVPFEITQFLTNGMVALQYSEAKIRYNIHHITPYTSDTTVEDNISENHV